MHISHLHSWLTAAPDCPNFLAPSSDKLLIAFPPVRPMLNSPGREPAIPTEVSQPQLAKA